MSLSVGSMSSIPGPRTNPTVKNMAHSSQRNLRSWQVNLGPVHLVVVLGVVMGCMACAFYLGFFSGQKVGVETALSNNLASAMKIPIEAEIGEGLAGDDSASDVYAKLGDSSVSALGAATESEDSAISARGMKAKPIPELGSIPTTENAPIILDGEEGYPKGDAPDSAKLGSAGGPQAGKREEVVTIPGDSSPLLTGSSQGAVRVLGADNSQTLGAIAAQAGATKQEAQKPAAPEAESGQREPKAKAMEVAKLSAQPSTTEELKPAPSDDRAKPEQSSTRDRPLITNSVPRGWFAQIMAPRSQAEAETLARKLQGSGFSVIIENARVRGEQYYRVLVGPEETRQQSERLLAQLKREPYIKASPFIRMVK